MVGESAFQRSVDKNGSVHFVAMSLVSLGLGLGRLLTDQLLNFVLFAQ